MTFSLSRPSGIALGLLAATVTGSLAPALAAPTATAPTATAPTATAPAASAPAASAPAVDSAAAKPRTIDPKLGFITIQWGRSQWQQTTGAACKPLAGARTLVQNAQDLASFGLFGVGGVVTSRTGETTRTCERSLPYSSWADLATLRDTYGWSFVSQGTTYADMTQMTTDAERRAESVASLEPLRAHGHTRAWGAFFYPNDKQDTAAQQVVTSAFAFGRKYGPGLTRRAAASTFPRQMITASVNGGRCNNPALACYTMAVNNDRRTTPVTNIANLLSPQAGAWGSVQFYRLVDGKYGTMGNAIAWDCTSSNWRNRWTSKPETYCRSSFLEALRARTRAANVVDPVTMAEYWGITPDSRG